jgi:nitrogenase molybdenum-iron protein NifN
MVIADMNPVPHEAARNACHLCAPLGAGMAFAGVANTLPYLHGGQGCATYIRRYTISHFREPVDIASSSFGENATVFGGKGNLFKGLNNVIKQYHPAMIGVASTCLAETIGEDVAAQIKEFYLQSDGWCPELIFAPTPSYVGSHYDGFHRAVFATVTALARAGEKKQNINILPNMISPADIRYLREMCSDFSLEATILPDYSETLDGGSWAEYHRIPEGGTLLYDIRRMGQSAATIEFNNFLEPEVSAGNYLAKMFGVTNHRIGIPVGVAAVDEFMKLLEQYSRISIPAKYIKERGRLLDSYVDGHKYVFGKRALVFGDVDFAVSIAAFLAEIGMIPIICTAGKERNLPELIKPHMQKALEFHIFEGTDFVAMGEIADKLKPDIIIGSGKGYPLARRLQVPLIRLNFPIHDRLGGTRLRCLGYGGTQELFDRVVNGLLEKQQNDSSIGHAYL